MSKKNTHTSLCIIVHLCIITIVTVHICMVTVACVFIILLISVRTFFSLSSPCTTNELSFPLLIFFFLRCTQTNTPTPTHKQTHTDKPTKRQIGARGSWSMLDRELMGPDWCLTRAHRSWSLLDWSFVLIGACGTIRARGSFAWTELVGPDRCLTGARGS